MVINIIRFIAQAASAAAKASATKMPVATAKAAQVGKTVLALSTTASTKHLHECAHYLKEEHSTELKDVNIGDEVELEGGVKKFIVGFIGHDHTVTISTDREIYYGGIDVAQKYAKIYAGSTRKAVVSVILADRMPLLQHHGPQRFENGFVPLSPKGLEEIGAMVMPHHEVTLATDLGLRACFRRCLKDAEAASKSEPLGIQLARHAVKKYS